MERAGEILERGIVVWSTTHHSPQTDVAKDVPKFLREGSLKIIERKKDAHFFLFTTMLVIAEIVTGSGDRVFENFYILTGEVEEM